MSSAVSEPTNQLLWTADRTCQELGISPKSLYNVTEPRGDLGCVRLGPTGRILRYDPDVVRQYVKAHSSKAAG